MAKHGKAYEQNKAAKVGETIRCACCGKEFVKRQYSQAFCCGECKNKYWNRKGDRHLNPDYYREYNEKHPENLEFVRERFMEKTIPGLSWSAREEREALREYMENEKFRDYVNDFADMGDDGSYVPLSVHLDNFTGHGYDDEPYM